MIYIAYYLGTKKENTSATLMDRLICAMTKSRYSHVELVYEYNHHTKFGTCWSSSMRDGGVRRSTINFGSGHWEMYRLSEQPNKGRILTWMTQQDDRKYDYFGALGVKFPWFKQSKQRWYCTELIAAALHLPSSAGISPQSMYAFFKERHTKITLE